jgi:uncharacterized protein YjbI with pentapeptide repeats
MLGDLTLEFGHPGWTLAIYAKLSNAERRAEADFVQGSERMADKKQLAILNGGVESWNEWRRNHPADMIDLGQADLSERDLSRAELRAANLDEADLSETDLSGANLFAATFVGANIREANLAGANLSSADLGAADLTRVDFREANLREANLRGADLRGANFGEADLVRADLREANLYMAGLRKSNLSEAVLSQANLSTAKLNQSDLSGADLTKANLTKAELTQANLSRAKLIQAVLDGADLHNADIPYADLTGANLSRADLTGANLSRALLVESVMVQTHLEGADLRNAWVYGIAAWDLRLDQATKQADLRIAPPDQPTITVDNLEVAQFVYLMLNNQRIRQVIDTITSKVVLILGRFTDERKVVLDALRDELRMRDYLPIVFDFDKPARRNLTETIRTLASLAHFVIADITDARSIPQELMAIVPSLPSVPVQPLLQAGASPYALFDDFRQYRSVLPVFEYTQTDGLLAALSELVIAPAEQEAEALHPATPGRRFG